MLLPMCTVLSMVSVDARVKPEKRQRAADALKLFTPKLCASLGVLADFGLCCQRFLRPLDSADHDIARSAVSLINSKRR